MPTRVNYKYDFFISYAREDDEWAKKLASTLNDKSFHYFFDVESLRVGNNWAKEIKSSLDVSRHLIVLWSNKAKSSHWVTREIIYFEDSQKEEPSKKIIYILLENIPTGYGDIQNIEDIAKAEAYNKGAQKIESALWQNVAEKIEQVIIQSEQICIPLIILTITKDLLDKIDFDRSTGSNGKSLNDILKELGIRNKAKIEKYYGNNIKEWKPFASNKNIWRILDEVKDDICKTPGFPRFRWDFVGDNFLFANTDSIKKEAKKFKDKLSVIIIDSISLYHESVKERLDLIYDCFRNDNSIIMMLAPFAKPKLYRNFKEQIEHGIAAYISDYFYKPWEKFNKSICEEPIAYCEGQIDDENSFKKFLFTTLRAYHIRLTPVRVEPSSIFLTQPKLE